VTDPKPGRGRSQGRRNLAIADTLEVHRARAADLHADHSLAWQLECRAELDDLSAVMITIGRFQSRGAAASSGLPEDG
jgi:hypothetical protein